MTYGDRKTTHAAAMDRLREHTTVSTYEAMAILEMGEPTVREAIRRGDIASIRLGRNIRVLSAPLRRQLGIEEAS
jgi:hypothetical protein